MAPNTIVYLRRSVEEVILSAAGTGASGTIAAYLPAEMWGARMAFQVQYSSTPQTAPSIPVLASVDGVNFFPLEIAVGTGAGEAANDVVVLASLNGEVAVVPVAGVKAIKIGTITLSAGTVTVTVRIQ